MRLVYILVAAVGTGSMLFPLVAASGTRSSPSCHAHRIGPQLWAWRASPGYRRVLGSGPERIEVTVRLQPGTGVERLVAIEDGHLRLRRVGGRLLQLGDVACASVTERGLDRLEHQAWVRRVELDVSPAGPLPLDVTAAEIHAYDARRMTDTRDLALTGEGVVIADLDAHIDVTHPAFFRPDGGTFSWLDVDRNGRFDPGTDAVDYNRDGETGPAEILAFFDACLFSLEGTLPVLDSANDVFDAGHDYLYLDPNGNGKRDAGPEAGFGDDDPAFGEPLFLADDVDGNGLLDPGEKLVALGTSKIRAVYDGQNQYLRGENLSTLVPNEVAFHGTCVTGILAGGTPGLTRLVGIAPGADILFGATSIDPRPSTLTSLLIWAVDNGADVVLQELAIYAGFHLDGSTNHEAVMDEAATQGVVMINPAGNPGGSKKHFRLVLEPGQVAEVPIVLPEPGEGDYTFWQAGLHWRVPARDISVLLRTPSGEEIDMGVNGGFNFVLADGTTRVRAIRDDSERGTAMYTVTVMGFADNLACPVATGRWAFVIHEPELQPEALEVFGFIRDSLSGWGLGAHYPEYTSDQHLVGFPATADSATTVTSYCGHAGEPFDPPGHSEIYRSDPQEDTGELRRYAGRGKRIDGVSIVDLAAPDNPLTPVSRVNQEGTVFGPGAYMVFGGTSGAGPHVAGAAALVKQMWPELDGFEVRQQLRDAAARDQHVSADGVHPVEDLWGAGKVRVYEALFEQSPEANTPPQIGAEPISAVVDTSVDLVIDVHDAEDPVEALLIWWDDDYDGTWDVGPLAAGETRTMTFERPGRSILKVRVVDSGGMQAAALVQVDVSEPQPRDGGDGGDFDRTDAGQVPQDGGTGNAGGGGCACGQPPVPAGTASLVLLVILAVLRAGVLRAR